jgi:transposase
MFIITFGFSPGFRQIATVDGTTGEIIERRLEHEAGEAEAFYAALPSPARVGMQATGHAHCFERVLVAQGHELCVGNPALIHATEVRKQKMGWRDALHILRFLLEDRLLQIWIPSPAERDARQLLRHRHKRVCFRTSVKNQSQALATGQGFRRIFRLNNLEAQ